MSEAYLDKFVKMPEMNGEKILRFLPPKKGGKLYVLTRIHMLWSPLSSISKSFHCHKELDKNIRWSGNCIICEKYNEFCKLADAQKVPYHYHGSLDALMGDLRKIKPNERAYYNVIDRDNDEKPLILSCGSFVHAKVIKSIIGDGEHYPPLGDISNIKTGRDFTLRKKMVNAQNRQFPNYDQSEFLAPSKAGTPKQIKFWSENLHDLSELRVLKPEAEMRSALIDMFGDFDTPEKKKFVKQKEIIRDINAPFQASFYA